MFDLVALEKCNSYNESEIRKALEKVITVTGGLSFVKEGTIVGIKANLVAGSSPDKAVTTHPALIKELSRMIIEKGGSVVLGDSPGGLYTAAYLKNIYKACGFLDLEKEMDEKFPGKFKLNDDFSISDGNFAGVSLKSFIYTGWLDKVDVIIDFAKLKTHAMMGMSCAVKNMFGTIPGTTKPEYHMRFPEEMAFANVMVDLNEFFKPSLYVVDAIDGMEGNGPTAGEKRHIGAILASKKPYALDMFCADLIGMGINDVATLKVAYDRHLGPKDISEVEFVSDAAASDIKVPDFKRATAHQSITFEGNGLFSNIESKALKFIYNTKPQVKKSECIGCKKCYETCPAKAITMVPGGKNGVSIPSIDRSKCIKCFCCQEFCPKGAMKVKANPLSKLVNSITTQH